MFGALGVGYAAVAAPIMAQTAGFRLTRLIR